MSEGNEQLLNNLEEGVIILDEGTHEALFLNDSAKKIASVDSPNNFLTNKSNKAEEC